MNSFFLKKKNFEGFKIEGEDFHHLKNVLRLRINEQVFCVFENEKFLCTISEIFNDFCLVNIDEKIIINKKNYKVYLMLGLIREQKWDFVLQKATELGVDTIIPIEFKRAVVKIDEKKENAKLARWVTICENAAKQSKRIDIPEIKSIVRDLNELKKYESDINLVCWEEDKKNLIKNEIKTDFETINIVVGPEGGLTKEEISFLESINYKTVNLGQNIMRAETVPLYLLSCLSYEKEG